MVILTVSMQNTQPDYVALATVLCLALIVAIMAIRKKLSGKKSDAVVISAPVEAPQKPPVPPDR